MTRLTSQELEALRDSENWKALWAAAVPWVKFAASSLRTDEREDLVQDGLLKVGKALKAWNPALGRFSTFVCHVSRQAMLTHIDRKHRVATPELAFHDADVLTTGDEHKLPLAPTYGDTWHIPEGFADPATEVARGYLREAAETLLTELNASDSLLLREYLGLPIFDDPAEVMPVKEIAASRGDYGSATRVRISRLQESMRNTQRDREYTDNSTSIYPPEGKQSWCTNLQKRRDRASFWADMGVQAAMGDIDAWRESAGAVWKDWSWKPRDLDISNGAKP